MSEMGAQVPYGAAIGWTVLHTFWSGSVIGLAAMVLRGLLRHRSPELRYGVAVGCWLVLLLLPVALFTVRGATSGALPSVATAIGESTLRAAESYPAGRFPGTWSEMLKGWSEILKGEWLAGPWLLGALLSYVWLGLGWIGTRRLERSSWEATGYRVHLAALRSELQLRIGVALHLSDRIVTPVLVGIVRPTILVPVALAARLSPEQLELVLLHEIAHLLRRDNLVKLAQRLSMPLTFFQPGSWIVSAWLREEREHCCDAFVLRHRNQPRRYANTLLLLAESRASELHLYAAMSGGPLLSRIRRILKLEEPSMLTLRKTGWVALLAASGLLLISDSADSKWFPSLAGANSALRAQAPAADDPVALTPCGAKVDANCGPCHQRPQPEAKPADPACSNCHRFETQPWWNPHGWVPQGHIAIGETPCQACHFPEPELPHGRVWLGLPAGHLGVKEPCSDCHVVEPFLEPLDDQTPCSDCHVGPLDRSFNPHVELPPGHAGASADSCGNCHIRAEPKAEKPRVQPHPMIDQPCTTCHLPPKVSPRDRVLLRHDLFSAHPCSDCHLPAPR